MNTELYLPSDEIVQFIYRNILMWIVLEEQSLYYITNVNKNVSFNKKPKEFKNMNELLQYCKTKFGICYEEIEYKILERI